jgi:hypothetical protein
MWTLPEVLTHAASGRSTGSPVERKMLTKWRSRLAKPVVRRNRANLGVKSLKKLLNSNLPKIYIYLTKGHVEVDLLP